MISHDTSDLRHDSATTRILPIRFVYVTVSPALFAVVDTQLNGFVERLVDRRV